jgi:hypothetical protein
MYYSDLPGGLSQGFTLITMLQAFFGTGKKEKKNQKK